MENASPEVYAPTNSLELQPKVPEPQVWSKIDIHIKTPCSIIDSDAKFVESQFTTETVTQASPSSYSRKEYLNEMHNIRVIAYNAIKDVKDPEHVNLTLEMLRVVGPDLVTVYRRSKNQKNSNPSLVDYNNLATLWTDLVVDVVVHPTVPHCSQASAIGLMIKARLLAALPPAITVRVTIPDDKHNNAKAISLQLADKERVCAAMENPRVRMIVSSSSPPQDYLLNQLMPMRSAFSQIDVRQIYPDYSSALEAVKWL